MTLDHSKKRILARGCDPVASQQAARALPPLMGNPEYVATSNDIEFIEKLNTQSWSVVFFAPGACRFDAAKQAIPGGNQQTKGWGLEQYKTLIYETQGKNIQIVETLSEQETLLHLTSALAAIDAN